MPSPVKAWKKFNLINPLHKCRSLHLAATVIAATPLVVGVVEAPGDVLVVLVWVEGGARSGYNMGE